MWDETKSPHSDRILYQPFVDCFGRMRHENPTLEVCSGKNVR